MTIIFVDMWRSLSVTDLQIQIADDGGWNNVTLAWRPPTVVEMLEIPVTYFIFIYHDRNKSTFHTNEVKIFTNVYSLYIHIYRY